MNFLHLAEILSVLSAITFAVGDLFGRFGIRYAPPFMGGFMSAVVGLVVFGGISLTAPLNVSLNLPGIGWFLLVGLIHPSFGFIVVLKAFQKAGVARTAAILGTVPFFSLSIAVLLLGEQPGWLVVVGTVLIILGVLCVSLEEGSEGPLRAKNLGYPFLAAIMFGVSPVLRKLGLFHIPSPILGMAISSVAGVVCLLASARLFSAGEGFSADRKGLWLYTLAGIGSALAVYLYFVALQKGTVSVVVPLLSTYPLFMLILVHFFLQQIERLTPRLVGGTVLIVSGAVVITGFA